ncbi:MAG: hypothetical protein M3N31_05340 [Actinomycetota bacterium]|nr:hypothetical protein [Actinomycetota bacterium]
MIKMLAKAQILQDLSIGSRVAEDEVDQLSRYFVETDQWRRILAGKVDVVFGPKGAGKSAIYTSLVSRVNDLFDRGIVIVAGENPRGTPAFVDIVAEPPTSEAEFVGLWKFYLLGLLNQVFEDWGIAGGEARRVREELAAAGLAPAPGGLRGLVGRVQEYVRRLFNPESIETGLKVDAAGNPVGITAKITLREPSAAERAEGFVSVDELIGVCAGVLEEEDFRVWLVFDRLDVAFAESRQLEANALRALFKVYLDLLSTDAIRLKIFLRSDIWRAVTEGGFREASHVTRELTIEWPGASLLNLVVRRLLQNELLVERYEVKPDDVLQDAAAQREFFDRLVPEQIDSGRNPRTFEWMLGRVADGTKQAAPRELIHLLDQTRKVQLAMLERGEPEPDGEILFSRQAFREALPEVSRVRLEKTVYAEYPNLREQLAALQGEKTNQSLRSLATVWALSEEDARLIAEELVEVGFFERRGEKGKPSYWVPFLYRSALDMVQGSAEPDMAEQE